MTVKKAEEKAKEARKLAESCSDDKRRKQLERNAQKAEVEVGRAKKKYAKRLRADSRTNYRKH